jgi:hypothetical protein
MSRPALAALWPLDLVVGIQVIDANGAPAQCALRGTPGTSVTDDQHRGEAPRRRDTLLDMSI